MYKKGAGNDKQGKDVGNRMLCPYRNFSQAIINCTAGVYERKMAPFAAMFVLKFIFVSASS